MWCKQCQQDVPAVPVAETDAYSCPRCGVELLGATTSATVDASAAEQLGPGNAAATQIPEFVPPNSPVSAEGKVDCVVEVALSTEPPFAAEPAIAAEPAFVAETPFVAEPILVTEVRATPETSPSPVDEPVPEPPALDAAIDQPPSFDAWELDEELRHIQRILAVEKAAAAPTHSPMDFYTRLDAAHRMPSRRGQRNAERADQRQDPTTTTVGWLSALISIVLSVGLMAFAFGGVLLVWSFVTGRQDLWTFGMPIAMAGQIVLLMGFILQMDRLWHDNRSTAAKLEHVDERLDDLRSNADLLGSSHRTPVQNQYGGPMAGSLDSQLMLADLKSQLDLLALKMGNQKGST